MRRRGPFAVRCEKDRTSHSSRGWYIVSLVSGVYYLHHDGKVRSGVGAFSDNPAFWPTEEAAQAFLDEWRENACQCP